MSSFYFIFVPIAYLVGSLLLGLLFQKQIVTRLRRLAQRTSWPLDDLFINALDKVSLLWFVLGGVALTINGSVINPTISVILIKITLVIFLGSATFILAEICLECLKIYTTKDDGVFPLTSVFAFLIKTLIFTLGALIILQSLGIAITPLLTAFGVGGVSLGLALQATLSNLMSGINIITSRKIQPGDYIQLKTGEEGYVVDIDLRHTVLQEVTQSYVIIPNAKVLSASLRNYNSLNKKQLVLTIPLIIPYETDLELLEGIVRKVASEISATHDIFESASVYYESFDYWNIVLNVYLKVRESAQFEHLQVKHNFIKKLNKSYQAQGISVSLPLPWLIKDKQKPSKWDKEPQK